MIYFDSAATSFQKPAAVRRAVLRAMEEKFAGREDITSSDIAECYEQVVSLVAAGKLFAPDTFEPIAGRLKEKTAGVVKALCLHVAHVCNLNCSYCFASQGKYHGERAVMS
ncbi:MAG: thioether cross-link-forming SCIFF peptide maturase, partial [Oscillospiraceae bacterium]|nr:thioether cross-link-forming SCIFF peptide maturase [Oscillospiraceae bacterium]